MNAALNSFRTQIALKTFFRDRRIFFKEKWKKKLIIEFSR